MKTKYIYIIIIGIVLILILFFKNDNTSVLSYKTEKLKKGTIQEKVTATGTLNPVSNIIIGASVSGMIKNIFVDYNSPVKKGQVLAIIDPEPFIAQVEQAKANLLMAEANLEKAKVALIEAENNYKRFKKLYEEKLISESEYERYFVNYRSAIAQLKDAKAKVAQARASLRQAQTNLNYTKIRSPVNGIVISRNIEIGQTVAASFQTPTLFQIAEDLSKMQINTNVDEADIGKVKEGQIAKFTVDAYPGLIYEGKVFQVRNAPITIQNVVTYDVVISVDNKDLKLKPGMTAQVSILTRKKENIFKVRNSALRVNPLQNQSDKTKKYYDRPGIWILKNNQPVRIEVEIGINDDEYVEVISNDLKENLDVIVEVETKTNKRKKLFF
ncbi:MAG: RND transporter [Leptospiraceae bacterium]|nr:MAG: RND transporter [Leptospiraceae bacterium]